MTSTSTNVETAQRLTTLKRKQQVKQQLAESRAATLALFEGVDHKAFCYQAHPEFSPVGWHLGHIGFIEAHWLLERSWGRSPLVPAYRRLFVADGLPKAQRQNLPTFVQICDYLQAIRAQVLLYLEEAPLDQQEWLWRWIVQHEVQHAETITWVLQLQRDRSPWLGRLSPISSRQFSASSSRGTESEMVWVEAGYFEQGNNSIDALDNEKSVHQVYLEAYWIDRYPVTRREYQIFIEAGGYRNSCWWSSEGWAWLQANPVSQPLYWDTADDHPVHGVSWYEAEAYAHFAGKRLPTEAEWEKAASWNPLRASQQRYPWGETRPTGQHCNHSNNMGQTMPVNRYKAGQSPYGCYDMLGNVWEWTATWFYPYAGFTSYPYAGYSKAYFDNQHRVLKGGSWATHAAVLRCAFRNWYHPGIRQHFAGFRCAHSNELFRSTV